MRPQAFHHARRRLLPLARLAVITGFLLLATSGCSVVMATTQPPKKDLSVLDAGTARPYVLAELGQPIWSGEKDGTKLDLFAFEQGSNKAWKISRAVFHATADLLTYGAWEVVGTPFEILISPSKMRVEVAYDQNDRVKSVRINSRDKSVPDAASRQEAAASALAPAASSWAAEAPGAPPAREAPRDPAGTDDDDR